MNVQNNKQPSGSLKISQEVLATISDMAACEIDGVVSLADHYTPIKSFFQKGITSKPIQISLNDDVAVVDISVNLKYGTNIPDVAERLQEAVKDAIQNMTGITVSKVNVHVAGIVFPQTVPAQQA